MSKNETPVKFVFGNHKHWTGMVWEWGEDSLANSLRGMKRVLEETGLKAGLNFDGKGLEELSLRYPQEMAWLKSALSEGNVELWGGTYTQPYGSLIGSESNVKQRQLGVRAFEMVTGFRPVVFCEEEFDFFPQLPQLLRQLGYKCAALFYQHTWHTPTLPKEESTAIWWEGVDGTRIKTVPFSDACLMRGIPTAIDALHNPIVSDAERPFLMCWLELLDKPNWMWSTDFAVEYLKKFLANDFRTIEPTTIADHLENVDASRMLVRNYRQEDAYHGICVAKNGDRLPQLWRRAEQTILRAELFASICSYQGLPYPQFDSYPSWKLEEAWRMLCLSQGHDAYECEGLTASVGMRYAQMAMMLALDVCSACEPHLGEPERIQEYALSRSVKDDTVNVSVGDSTITLHQGLLTSWEFRSTSVLDAGFNLFPNGKSVRVGEMVERGEALVLTGEYACDFGAATIKWEFSPLFEGLQGQVNLSIEQPPKPGIEGAIVLPFRFSQPVQRIRADAPFQVCNVKPAGEWLMRQPLGHWLTSRQQDQFVPKPIVHHDFIALDFDGFGIQYVSGQNSLALAADGGFDAVIYVNDAWDQGVIARSATINFSLVIGDILSNRQLLTNAQKVLNPKRHERMTNLVQLLGNAHITAIRKSGEWLQVRLFETEGTESNLKLTFPYSIETVRFVDLLGKPISASFSIENRTCTFALKAHEIATLELLFKEKRTEYLDLAPYRAVWVGTQSV